MKIYLNILSLILFSGQLSAQIKTESSQSAEFYVKNVLLGEGIEVANIKYVGKKGALGQFDADSTVIGVKSGIILSTGNVDSINGPNNSTSYTSWGEPPNERKIQRDLKRGDRDLNKLVKRRSRDVCVIEFDFVPIKNKLEFRYVFASEEYPEFVGSKFNDVFAFFLSGPNIGRKVNLAVLPDGVTPISINNVNHRKNSQYFRHNGGFYKRLVHKIKSGYINLLVNDLNKIDKFNKHLMRQVQFDGLTTVLKVQYDIIPYQKYHIKIAIGDGSDNAYDSAVFLEAGSFVSIVDKEGEYYDTLKTLDVKSFDIDSILGLKSYQNEPVKIEAADHEFEITDIHFAHNSSELNDSSIIILNKLTDHLKKNNQLKCTLWGYTDNTGSKKHNQKLSEKRALRVLEYLVSKGIERSRLSYEGHNFENPKHDNRSNRGRAKNRRVEILVE